MSLEFAATPARQHPHHHAVQFYEDDAYLAETVGRFLVGALAGGEPALVIATPEHRQLFAERLTRSGVDVAACVGSGQLVLLDARETLAEILVDGVPSWQLFRSRVAAVLARCRQRRGGRVHAYGEMVDLLWRADQQQAAIALEELWNQLGQSDDFSLLCAYLMDGFVKHADSDGFAAICRAHDAVAPTERLPRAVDADRDREISRLQQRARALEHEVAHRQALERELRSALRAREESERRLAEALASEKGAREEAERTVRFNELFAGILGHDLRNPLSAIVAGAHYLVRMNAGEKVGRTAGRILSSSERMSRMVDQLLDFTRLRVGDGLELRREAMDLGDLCRRVKEELEAVHPERTAEVTGAGATVGDWDPDRLLQVFSNLVGNALTHGAAGPPVSLRVDGRGADVVEVTVHNAGAIPPEVLPVVFEPFRGSSKYHRAKGLGLGLHITRELVIAHGGSIEVTSNEADGTTFLVKLPRRAPAPEPPQ